MNLNVLPVRLIREFESLITSYLLFVNKRHGLNINIVIRINILYLITVGLSSLTIKC